MRNFMGRRSKTFFILHLSVAAASLELPCVLEICGQGPTPHNLAEGPLPVPLGPCINGLPRALREHLPAPSAVSTLR